jgi:hypothetical protein
MNFQEAADALDSGNFVSREAWSEQLSYLVALPGVVNFLKVNLQPKPEVLPWAANREDSSAKDWFVTLPEVETESSN